MLCADDFGLSEGVSRGILELAHQGRVSATSVMTTRPRWASLAPDLGAFAGVLGIGLHLNLTTAEPLGPMPILVPGGALPPLGRLMRAALTRSLPLGEVRAEIERQLDAFEDALGRGPDFVDGHQHVHVLPGIRTELLHALAARRHAGPVWMRDPSDSVMAITHRGVSAGKALMVKALAVGFGLASREAGFATNEGFSGFSPLGPTTDVARVFERSFAALSARPVVMCHPGHIDDELRRLDPAVESRARELAYLASEAFAELLRSRGLQLAASPGQR